ncbi:MAG: NAD(P)/FAD-dependent oxidoreductase [Clostridiales bacterium]|nr:NAD(P)/FAD-dependent oxidoreductase [Clostridiales bacterium]
MYDVAIIGGGAAGVSAAVTLQALNKTFIWFGKKELSEKIRKAELVRNYPGLPFVTGGDLAKALSSHVAEMGIEMTEKVVTGVYALGSHYAVACDKEIFEAKTVILATGVETLKPTKGELEFLGRGVSYCATCDGFLYKDKTIAIVCASKEYEHEAAYLAGIAAKAYFVPTYKTAAAFGEKVETVRGVITEIIGDKKVTAIRLKDEEIAVDGVFFLKSAISPSALVPGVQTENGHVCVDRECKTNLDGCFAAGDCTGRPYQYAKAVGEGNVAAHAAVAFLAKNK